VIIFSVDGGRSLRLTVDGLFSLGTEKVMIIFSVFFDYFFSKSFLLLGTFISLRRFTKIAMILYKIISILL
jgi:hypothetical protein